MTRLYVVVLVIEDLPLNIKQYHETCQEMFVADNAGCQAMYWFAVRAFLKIAQ